jgi:hypothetical protein
MLKGIITGLVLTLSTAAFAAPTYDQAPARVYAPDHARDHGFKRRPPMMHWQTLSSSKRLSGRTAIRVDSNATYSKLKIEAASGSSFVDKVLITFGNGQTQLVDLDKRLNASGPLLIDLAGNQRKITKVVIVGRSAGWRSSINVLAV